MSLAARKSCVADTTNVSLMASQHRCPADNSSEYDPVDVQGVVSLFARQEMEKLQARGELGEEELRALEEDVTGKVCFKSPLGLE